MGLKNLISISALVKHSWLIILVLFAFLFIGCGESEEATMEESQAQEANQAPESQKPADQALTSFIGADTEQPAEAPPPTPAVSSTQLAQYEKQIEDLRTENTGLKQKIVKIEQENRTMNARLAEVDAKFAAEKLRADTVEALMKTGIQPSKVTELKPRPVAIEEEGALPATQSTYEDAMDAFKTRKYDSALRGFKAIVDGSGDDDLTNRAKYWLGETYFAKKNYKAALPLFQEVLKMKKSEKRADAQFMIARTFENLGNKAKAKAAYEKVVKNYPMSKNVKVAKERWAKL